MGVVLQAQQAEAGKRKQEDRQRSFQPPAEVKKEEEGKGERVNVAEVKRKVKEAMKRRKKN